MIIIICAGFIIPIYVIRCSTSGDISYAISYMIYFPIMAFMGKVSLSDYWSILTVQITWLVLFVVFISFFGIMVLENLLQ